MPNQGSGTGKSGAIVVKQPFSQTTTRVDIKEQKTGFQVYNPGPASYKPEYLNVASRIVDQDKLSSNLLHTSNQALLKGEYWSKEGGQLHRNIQTMAADRSKRQVLINDHQLKNPDPSHYFKPNQTVSPKSAQ